MRNIQKITSEVDWISEQSKIRLTYEKFVIKLQLLLKDILDINKLKYHSIDGSTKSIESFSDKIKRPGKNYTHPLNELTDLAGLRIIVYYDDD